MNSASRPAAVKEAQRAVLRRFVELRARGSDEQREQFERFFLAQHQGRRRHYGPWPRR